MKDLKIGKKLFIGVGSLGLILIVVTFLAFWGVFMSGQRTQRMYDYNLLAINSVGKMKETFQQERALIRNLLLFNKNSDTYITTVAQIQQCEKKMGETFTEYEATILDQDNRDLFLKVKNLYDSDFNKFKTNIKAYCGSNDAKGALHYLVSAAQINTDLSNALDAIAQINNNYALTSLSDANRNTLIILGIGIAVTAFAIFWTLFLIRYFRKNVAEKITAVVGAANELAVGNIDIRLEVDRRDEVGELAAAFNEMISNIKNQADIAELIARGDFTSEYTPHSEQDVMGTAFVKTINGLDEVFSIFRDTVMQVNAGAEQVSNGAQALSQGATEQAGSIEELSATINDISGQVLSNATNASKAKELSVKTGQEVEAGNSQMQKMITAMGEINHSSEQISKIIKVIDDIAFQTNILALNAAVEAARAGAAGKGFAVVAEEVRSLAARSAEAAKNTADLIQDSIGTVSEGTKIADATAASLKEIVESVEEVSKLIHNIDVASSQQATSLAQVSQGIEQISSVVQTNAATAEESAAASEELSSQAHMLESVLATLKLKGHDDRKTAANTTKAEDNYSEMY